jgi:hypothetical protein
MKTPFLAATLLFVTVTAPEASAQYAQGYGGQSGYGQQQQPSGSGMEAGGLAPPSGRVDNDPYATTSPTEQELQRAEREDSGRGLEFFWINAEFGFEHLGLQTFKANNLVDAAVVETNPTGLLYGGALGVRLVFITLGARFRLGNFPEWQLWTLNAELGLRIPLGALEPYFTFGGGYASLGAFDSDNVGGDLNQAGVDVTGYDIRGGFGMDYYFSDAFSLGANLTGELLFLTRPGASLSDLQAAGSGSAGGGSAELATEVYTADGSSIGSGVTLTAVAGLHF